MIHEFYIFLKNISRSGKSYGLALLKQGNITEVEERVRRQGLRRRNHVVPASYLNCFPIDGKKTEERYQSIYCYRKSSDKNRSTVSVRKAKTNEVPIKKDFLNSMLILLVESKQDKNNKKVIVEIDDEPERVIAYIEKHAAPVLKKCNNFATEIRLDPESRQAIAALIGTIYIRSWTFQRDYSSAANEAIGSAKSADSSKTIHQATQSYRLETLYEYLELIERSIVQRDWLFRVPNGNKRFLTSDNPVVTFRSGENQGWDRYSPHSRGVSLYFPLGPRLLLQVGPTPEENPETRVNYVSSAGVVKLNKILIQRAERFVFATFDSSEIRRELARSTSTCE